METIGSLKNKVGSTVCKMFTSSANKRSNEFKVHKHAELEISLILEGQGLYNTNTGIYDIMPGDIFLFSTNEFHCITDIFAKDGAGHMELLNLHFQPSFVWSAGNDYLKNDYLRIFFGRNKDFTNRLDRGNAAIGKLSSLLLSIKTEFENKELDYEAEIKSQILQLMIAIHRHFPVTEESSAAVPNQLFERIESAINYIDLNYCSHISLTEIAQKAFMSKAYFCTVFKSMNGLTPWEYINIKRINKASELLKTTDSSILSIATQCGYNNTANFNKIFKQITNTTPKKLRD